ncbi:hypothetical protein Bca101_037269 [Brassica carinata]
MREVEAYSDPLSPYLASGKGSLLQLRLRRLLVTESGGLQSSALPLRNPVSFGLRLLVRFVSSSVRLLLRWVFGSLRMRYHNAVKNGYGFVGGLSVTELRRTRLSMVLFRRRRGGGGQVEAVTTRDALMEQISPRVEPASSTRYPTGSCGF